MGTRLFLPANVGSFESVHLGYRAKYHPPPVYGDSSAGDNSGDEDSSLISEEVKLSCALKTEETSITSSPNSQPPKQLPSTWENNYHQEHKEDKVCAPGAVAMLLDAMGLPTIATKIWMNRNERCSSTLAKTFKFQCPDQIKYALTDHYFEDP